MRDHVLVIRFSSLGDVVLVAPVFRALKTRLADAYITFLTRSEYAGIHQNNPWVDAVWSYDPAAESLWELRRRIVHANFSLTADLHGSLRSRFITAGASHPVTRHRKQHLRRFWLVARPRLKRNDPLDPVVDRYLEAVGAAGEEGEGRIPKVDPGEEVRTAGTAWRSAVLSGGGEGGRLIALLPGARHPAKEWPWRSFLELGEIIGRAGDRAVVLPPPGGPAERFRSPEGEEKPALSVSAPVEEANRLAGVLAACDAVVANDSGPMHLAAAVGTPVVGIFGPTSPALGFAPVANLATSCHLDIHCSPCSRHGARACWRDRRYCLEDLTPPEVYRALKELLNAANRAETA